MALQFEKIESKMKAVLLFLLLFLLLWSSPNWAADFPKHLNATQLHCVNAVTPSGDPSIGGHKSTIANPRLLLALLRTPRYISEFSEVSDRVSLRLIETLNPDILEKYFTPRTREKIQNWMRTENPTELLAELSKKFGVSRQEALAMALVDGENLLREMFNARNLQNWDEVIRIYDQVMPETWKKVAEAKLQAALALNRRNGNHGEDRERAKKMTQQVIDTSPGKSILSEAYGIRARIFKDQFAESKRRDPPNGNPSLLSKAIRTYLRGFHENPMDFYPGAAALSMLLARDMPGDQELVRSYAQLVQNALDSTLFRLKDRGLMPDFWTYSTALLLYVLNGEWKKISDTLPDLIANSAGKQNIESLLGDLNRVQVQWSRHGADRSSDLVFLATVIETLTAASEAEQTGLSLGESSPTYVSNLKFPDMENVFFTDALALKSEISQTGIAPDLNQLSKSSQIPLVSFHRFLQQSPMKSGGVLLAATGPYGDVVREVSMTAGLTYWREAYSKLGIVASPANSEIFLEKLLETETPIFFLVPKNFQSVHAGSHTLAEFTYIKDHWSRFSKQVRFVIGFESVIPLDYETRLNPRDLPTDAQAIALLFLKKYKRWLESLGDKVKEYSLGSQFSGSLYPLIYDVTLGQIDLHKQMRRLHTQAMPSGSHERPSRILDMGGGTGLLARDLEEGELREVEIFDSSSEMTKVARRKGVPADRIAISSILNLIRSDGRPVGDETVDGVTSSNVFYLLSMEQIQQVFAEAFRVLKPGGRFSVSSMAAPRSAEDNSHQRFLEVITAKTEELEKMGMVPPGAAKVILQSNSHLLEREPTFLTEQMLLQLGRGAGFKVTQPSQSYYLGAGIFMVFEKSH